MRPHLIKGREVLDQQVLQDTALIDLARIGLLPLPAIPVGIGARPAHGLGVFEIGNPGV